ncbi:gastrula zinc finger protein XlCGF26.1-like [Anoplophora glabripennis]|uniref:gastrula zinc finger protein XlCGF26.1-like n=1 Tax=Anoplophora glabripennis TaxID=217634 RepID=UPI000873CDF0|nr:gastrula zinc finger protein XlCGF26.1-like [Anoplophora glabripennis]
MKKCNVCLKKRISTISVKKSDKNNVKWYTKLQDVIPELQWLEKYMICKYCTKQLEKAWEFKRFVLDREKNWRNETNVNGTCLDRDCDNTELFTDDKKGVYCIICFKVFTTITQLQQHKLQIHNEQLNKKKITQEVFTCYNCNDSFDTKENLINHIEKEHKGPKLCSFKTVLGNSIDEETVEGVSEDYDTWAKLTDNDVQDNSKFYCKLCGQPYATEEILQIHYKACLNIVDNKLTNVCKEETNHGINEESRPYFCEECRINFTSILEFNLHNFSKHNVEVAPVIKKRRGRKPLRKFNCEMCNEEFGYVKLVVEHCISVHAMDKKIIKPYSCEKCDMRFVSSANLDQHRNYHNKNRTHICSLCGKGFITKSDLTVHEYTHYNRRNYKCTLCDKAFNTNKNLRTHNLVVHTDRSLWKYACSICEKRFPLKTNYDQHLRRHTGEKEYACHICKKPFISKSELQRHIHMHSNIRAFKCSNCDKEYKERRTYQAHLAKKHGIGNVKVTIREKKFVCHICPSQFYDKQKLMRHICSHSGLKPFPCYACDKKFTDKSYLKHHLKTAHNIIEQSKLEAIQ